MPNKTLLNRLEVYQKRLLKQILNLPPNTADAAVYSITGYLPIEAHIHKRAITLFNSVCLQSELSVEKRLARRQLAVKPLSSHSWFIAVKQILWKYDLPSAEDLLDNPVERESWKTKVRNVIHSHWHAEIIQDCTNSITLRYLNTSFLKPGKAHPLVQQEPRSSRDANRSSIKLKLMTGTYVFQSNRAKYNKFKVDETCLLCGEESETTEHFILRCSKLSKIRSPIIIDIETELSALGMTNWNSLTQPEQAKRIINCTHLCQDINIRFSRLHQLGKLEFQCKRLIFCLHSERYRILNTIKQTENKKKHKTVATKITSRNIPAKGSASRRLVKGRTTQLRRVKRPG